MRIDIVLKCLLYLAILHQAFSWLYQSDATLLKQRLHGSPVCHSGNEYQKTHNWRAQNVPDQGACTNASRALKFYFGLIDFKIQTQPIYFHALKVTSDDEWIQLYKNACILKKQEWNCGHIFNLRNLLQWTSIPNSFRNQGHQRSEGSFKLALMML